ncbi:8815_t:CDS:2 [Scutellospora calospora]|uniref:8815_t:CDS:1 n=1 Tax=Scutellospora calospora TaxID=85575 RepID=A0ACA9L7S1_9GLOM|nr:8815_t:CDS:2 [Scutellospora calospora]
MPKNKFSLSDTMMIAESYGEKCFSKEYINCEIPMLWECSEYYQWKCSFRSIKNRHSWCSYCSNRKLNISVAKELACAKNRYHQFLLSLSNIKNGKNWYREYMKLGLEFAQNLANKRSGTCLSSSYHNRCTSLSWKCSKKHSCTKLDISVAKAIAYSRGGECLIDSYTNCKSQLLWRCNKNHQWYATLSHVKNDNTWYPYCSKYKRESLCREIMSKYLRPPSKIRQPDFLKTLDHLTGLELDIYYLQYGFATEVQGEQHERYIEFFYNGDPNNFTKQQEQDQLKKELCEEN